MSAVYIVVVEVAAGAANATAVTRRWTGGGATTEAVTITKIADDRTPGTGGQTTASATITTTASLSDGMNIPRVTTASLSDAI